MPDRRTLLAAASLGLVAACTGSRGGTQPRSGQDEAPRRSDVQPERISYGDDPAQFGELHRPETSRGVVVLVHGGFWRARYDLSLMAPLAADLAIRGWTAWNIEYRRVGNGGGWPATFDDVAAAVDALADVDGLDTTTVVTVGHSAGGHLAAWAAARGRFDRWQPARVPVTAVVSQAGVLDLGTAYDEGLGADAVSEFLGRPPRPDLGLVDPLRQVPLDVPVACVHGRDDQSVPLSQSRAYVDAATAAGATTRLVEVDGDHFTVIDPASEAWARTVALLEEL